MTARPPRSPIAQDEELADFISSSAGHLLQREIVEACRERFGRERTPSLSAINRFLTASTTVSERTLKRPSTALSGSVAATPEEMAITLAALDQIVAVAANARDQLRQIARAREIPDNPGNRRPVPDN